MNGFELNKIVGAILLALLVAMLSGFVAHEVAAPKMLDKNVYVVEGVGAPTTAAVAEAPKGPADILPMLAKADVDAGQKTARACAACHSFGKGEAAKIGPNLYGVVGRHHASTTGFDYSEGMKATKDKVWDYDELNHFIYKPKAHIQGTKMTFAGLTNDTDRANVIAWLRTLADTLVALPK